MNQLGFAAAFLALAVAGPGWGADCKVAGRALFDAVPEPKQFVTIRDGDHNDATPADPQTYWTAVDAFTASLVVSR